MGMMSLEVSHFFQIWNEIESQVYRQCNNLIESNIFFNEISFSKNVLVSYMEQQ